MIGQSFAIITVILLMSLMFLRSGRRAGALFSLPLISVPVFHLLGFAAAGLIVNLRVQTHLVFDAAGFVIGIFLCYKLSKAIDLKRLRSVYFICCTVFLAALMTAFMRYHI